MVLALNRMPPRRMALLLGALVLLLACGVPSLMVWQALPANQLAAARSRWSAHAPARYRIVSEAGARCVLDVEVRAEQVVAVHRRDHCSPPARTVSELFRLIDNIRVISYPCVSFSCACRSVMGTRSEFDGALGFPRTITVWSRREPNLWNLAYWRYRLEHGGESPPCTRASEAVMVRVVSLTPIP
ncbi:MAG TPA: hypothetical protein VNL77_18645 [Roseiflexaceae bacterium]|nr:hypothetical protein [Roseiflexaceae bacterium]